MDSIGQRFLLYFDAFLDHLDVRGVRRLVLGLMAGAALVIPLVVSAGHHRDVLANDTFDRQANDGWQHADKGGAYAYPAGAKLFSVDGSTGEIVLPNAGASAAATLDGVSSRDVSVRFSVRLGTAPTGGGTHISAVLRRTANGEYRASLRFAPDGVYASLLRVTGDTYQVLAHEQRVAGVSPAANQVTALRARITGTSPVDVRLMAWKAGTHPPTKWTISGIDRHGLVAPGNVGVRASLDSTATVAPVHLFIDNLVAKAVSAKGNPNPTPSPTAKPTPKPTPKPTATPRPTPSGLPDPVANDRFERTVRGGWGRDDSGAAYGVFGNSSDYFVSGGTGHLTVAPGNTRIATLPTAEIRDTDVSFRFSADQLAGDGSSYAYAVVRHQASGDEYRIKARVDGSGKVYLHATRFVGGTESDLGTEVAMPGLTGRPGTFLWVRAQVVGANPVALRIRAWADGSNEPRTWAYRQTDAAGSLTAQGAVGLMAYVSSYANTGNIGISFDDFRASAPSSSLLPPTDPEPTPTDSPDPTNSPDPTPTPQPTPQPTPPPTPKPTPTPDPSQTWYVATDGSDSNDGSKSSPWLTLQHAADSVPSGATVIVQAGRYAGFTTSRSGIQGNPTVYEGDPSGDRPVLDGRLGGRLDVVKISGAHDIRISHLVVTGSQGGDYAGSGIRTENGANRIEISDDLIRDNHSYGVNSYDSTNVTIRDNEVTGNEEGIQIAHSGDGTRILDNRVHDNDQMLRNTPRSQNNDDDAGATAIGFLKTTGHVVASRNVVWGNRAPSYDYTWDGSAFDIYGASDVTITDNVMWDNENVFETGTDPGVSCTDNVFARNVAYAATTQGRSWGAFIRCGTDMTVANNTFADIEGFVFSIGQDSGRFSGALDGLTVVNNLVDVQDSGARIFGLTTSLPSSVRIDYNLARTSGQLAMLPDGRTTSDPQTFTSWTGYQGNGLSGDPRFADPADEDYTIKASSPAVDAGTRVRGITDSFSGGAPDVGRFERP